MCLPQELSNQDDLKKKRNERPAQRETCMVGGVGGEMNDFRLEQISW